MVEDHNVITSSRFFGDCALSHTRTHTHHGERDDIR